MILFDKYVLAVQRAHPLFKCTYKNAGFKTAFRTFFKKKKEPASVNRSNDNDLKVLTGYDDENFSHNLKKTITNPRLFKTGLVNFLGEFKKFYYEENEKIKNICNPRVDKRERKVDMLYTFEAQEDIKKFTVNTDSSFNSGFSSASLKLTNEGTAVFSGNICTDVPRDGNVKTAGYANISSHRKMKAFFRPDYLNWSGYTDLVFKIRGDGRTYMVLLNLKGTYDEAKYISYGQFLYTRGGPYWQIAKMQFSHFFVMTKGILNNSQSGRRPLNNILTFGITATGYDGPFKLEIDYIGLELDERQKAISPYEEYK